MFAGSKDYVGLVLFGTTGQLSDVQQMCSRRCARWRDILILLLETKNDLAEAGGGYQNITVGWPPAPPSLEFLKYITNDIQPGDTPGDCIHT